MLALLVLLIVGQGVIVAALLFVARMLGEYTASTALLQSQIVQALAEIARIRASDRLIEPQPAPFTSEESLR